jgi:hypothetical protein
MILKAKLMEYFNRENLKIIRDEIETALSKVSNKHGIVISLGYVRFTSNEARIKLTLSTIKNQSTLSGNTESAKNNTLFNTKEGQEFINYAVTLGIPQDYLGKTFILKGHTFQIIGLNRHRRKYPIIAIDLQCGRRYKLAFTQLNSKLFT